MELEENSRSARRNGNGSENGAYPPEKLNGNQGNGAGVSVIPEQMMTMNGEKETGSKTDQMLYTIYENPPWYLCIVLGFQHYLTMFGATVAMPFILAPHLCMTEDAVGISELMNTIFFVSGICTLLQTTFGNRLPIVQGGTFTFLGPTIAILAAQPYGKCPDWEAIRNATNGSDPDYRAEWTSRLREIQGAITVSSLLEVVLGMTGLVGLVLRFITPLTIVPTITLIALPLFGSATGLAQGQWGIALMTCFLIALFSQYLVNINIPCLSYSRGTGCVKKSFPFFKLFPVILAIAVAWLVCYLCTIFDGFPEGHVARTDLREHVMTESKWFRFPYPGQWGVPKVSVAGVLGMIAGVFASMVESVGDYYACARLSGAPPPPTHAINRGIMMEGIGCIIAGVFGTGNGTTSYSENIGAIGITKVGSRRVVQAGAIIMIFLGMLGKFGALFVTVPDPVIGGVFLVMFGMIAAVGLSSLQYVDLNSSRNLFVLGFSLFFGLAFPQWIEHNGDKINTGSSDADQIIRVLLSTSMFVGGMIGMLLDNTIPGTDEERGVLKWRALADEYKKDTDAPGEALKCYDLPFGMSAIRKVDWFRHIPFCPTFTKWGCGGGCCRKRSDGGNINSRV